MRSIAFIGRAGSGKDSAASRLYPAGYRRVALADPVREVALHIDPWVETDQGLTRLSTLVDQLGWDRAKRGVPEVRRLLQNVGTAVRSVEPDFWLRQALRQVAALEQENVPVVVTDCRFRNEATALREAGFLLARIVRPGLEPANHVSETDLDSFPTDATLCNDSTIEHLFAQVDALLDG